MATCRKKESKIFEKLPFEIVEVANEGASKITSSHKKYVFIGPKRYVEPDVYNKVGLDIYNFEARPDDVYLVGFPRSGTTLHCEMVWLIGNDLDYERAAKNFLDYRFPHIDFDIIGTLNNLNSLSKSKDINHEGRKIIGKYQELDLKGLAKRNSRRFIKSHLPLSLMPPHIFEVGAKVIYCARNPRDALVSLHHMISFFAHSEAMHFRDLFESFTTDLLWNCPYFEHVKEAWERRNDKNLLFLFYEDTIKDKRRTIQRVADFLGKNLSKEQIDSLEDHLSFEKFRNNNAVNCDQLVKIGYAKDKDNFIRKGKSGSWKGLFDEEMDKKFDQWMEKNLKGTDLRFPEM